MNHQLGSQPLANPWEVPSLDEFLFYCCPECDLKTKEYNELFNHAVQCHRQAKVLLIAKEASIVKEEVPDQTYEQYETEPEAESYQ